MKAETLLHQDVAVFTDVNDFKPSWTESGPRYVMLLQDVEQPECFVAVGGAQGAYSFWLYARWTELSAFVAKVNEEGARFVRMPLYPEDSRLEIVEGAGQLGRAGYLPALTREAAKVGARRRSLKPAVAQLQEEVGEALAVGPDKVWTRPPVEDAVGSLQMASFLTDVAA